MAWTVKFTDKALTQVAKLDKPTTRRVLTYLKKLEALSDPRMRGKTLTGPMRGLWRYRVGDYRVICNIQDETLTILALNIGHRSHIYRH